MRATKEQINQAVQYMRIYDKKGLLNVFADMVETRNDIARNLANQKLGRLDPDEIGVCAADAGRLDAIDDFLHCVNKYFINIDIDFETTRDGENEPYEEARIWLYDKERDEDVPV